MSSPNTTFVGIVGTAITGGLKFIASLAGAAQALTLAEWASIATMFAGFATGMWVSCQIAHRLREIVLAWRAKRRVSASVTSDRPSSASVTPSDSEPPAVSLVEPPAVSPVEPPAVSHAEPPAVSPVEPLRIPHPMVKPPEQLLARPETRDPKP